MIDIDASLKKKPNRIAIRVNAAAQRMIRKGHPWVFESSITKITKDAKSGDIAVIFDKKNKFLAVGLYDPDSPIRIKILECHKPVLINKDWFVKKGKSAFEGRRSLLKNSTNGYRLIHGENDGLPGLIIDIYGSIAVIKLYTLIWTSYLEDLILLINKVVRCDAIVLRLSRNVQKQNIALKDGQILDGELLEEEVVFKENDVLFLVNVIRGHKTGCFLDHRHNRKKLGELAKGKSVLDVFSYTGGFSIHALIGGAKEVVSVDISTQALEMVTKSAALNKVSKNHKTICTDAFMGLKDLIDKNNKFDIVVIDPPSFAKSLKEVPKAINSYRRLTKLAVQLINKEGILILASCSSRVEASLFFDTIEEVLADQTKAFTVMEKTFHDIDHPISFDEGAYLKCGFYSVIV